MDADRDVQTLIRGSLAHTIHEISAIVRSYFKIGLRNILRR